MNTWYKVTFPVSRKRTNFNVLYCIFEYYMHHIVTFSREHFNKGK